MNFKIKLIYLIIIMIIIVGIYYFLSPYQNCILIIKKKIDKLNIVLATEVNQDLREILQEKIYKLNEEKYKICSENNNW